jgi:isopenicillin N synthase-like dioxygenase
MSAQPFHIVDLRDRAHAADQVAEACSQVGVFLLRGHGLDPALLKPLKEVSAEFFDAPEEYKLLHHHSDTSRGYIPVGTETLGATRDGTADFVPDIKEAFGIGGVDIPGSAADFRGPGLRKVTWPDRLPSFRAAWLAYYKAVRLLADEVMALLAEALGVAETALAASMDRSADFLRVINYPDQAVLPAPGALRAAEHTDFGVLTILACDDVPGGLQVRQADGSWTDVPVHPDALIVNIGDLMAYWTDHRWVSAVHRVANPPSQAYGRARRQSVVFFHNPNLDAVIQPLYGPQSRPAVVAGEWLRSKTLRQRMTHAET